MLLFLLVCCFCMYLVSHEHRTSNVCLLSPSSGHSRQPTLPLLRLRVEYIDEEDLFNVVRFGHRFAEEVANNDEILLFRKSRKTEKKGGDASAVDMGAMDAVFGEDVRLGLDNWSLHACLGSPLTSGLDLKLELYKVLLKDFSMYN